MTRIVALLTLLASLVGCGIPRDPDGTLDRVRARGVLVVGVSESPPHAVVTDGAVTGPDADVVTGFARQEGLRVEWVQGGEEQLVRRLEDGTIDLMVGGLTDQSPWTTKVGLTRPYAEDTDESGRRTKRVLAVPLGENALVAALERHIDAGGRP